MLIMKWLWKRYKNCLYGPFEAILKILAAENGKSKNKFVQNSIFTCYRFQIFTSKYIFWEQEILPTSYKWFTFQ